jgi:hypothetical protein
MKPAYQLDHAGWNRLVQDVAKHSDDLTLKRGYQYYKQGRVEQLRMSNQQYIEAYVQGNEQYFVFIDIEVFSESHCNCPVKSTCKHLIAVLLEFAERLGHSVYTLVNAKTNAQPKAPIQKPTHLNRKAEEDVLKEQALLLPNLSIPQWHAFFELCVTRYTENTRNLQFVQNALAAIENTRSKLSAIAEPFCNLHSQLFVLSKLTKQAPNQSSYLNSYLAYQIHPIAIDLQNAINQTMTELATIAADPANEELVQQTLSYLRHEMLMESIDQHYFLIPYLNYWSKWVSPVHPPSQDKLLYSAELEELDTSGTQLGAFKSGISYKIAQIGLHFYQGNDQEAWKLLHALAKETNLSNDYLVTFLSSLSESGQWSRLVTWLIETAPMFRSFRNSNLPVYSDFWETAIQHHPSAEQQMWDTLVFMLPYSRTLYEDKLMLRGQWKRWMDYHLSIESDPLDFRVTELAPLEKNAPEVLLPFYHQAVERYVSHKNRDSYKAAVKMLKRLAKLYKKMKQEPRWEHFLDVFTTRNSRLRALQEELRKGKLLP